MSNETPKLSLPFIMPAQAQKHVTHNEAIELLDMIVQLTLDSAAVIAPPSSPGEGQTWALGASPTGAWAGNGDMIASWRGGGWLFVTPQEGWMAVNLAMAPFLVLAGGALIWLMMRPKEA